MTDYADGRPRRRGQGELEAQVLSALRQAPGPVDGGLGAGPARRGPRVHDRDDDPDPAPGQGRRDPGARGPVLRHGRAAVGRGGAGRPADAQGTGRRGGPRGRAGQLRHRAARRTTSGCCATCSVSPRTGREGRLSLMGVFVFLPLVLPLTALADRASGRAASPSAHRHPAAVRRGRRPGACAARCAWGC